MATQVTDIFSGIETVVTTNVPTFKKLPRIYDLEDNDFRRIKDGYAVRHLEALNSETVVREYTLDHRFEVILTTRVIDKKNDTVIQTAINDLYDKADEILADLISTKISLPTTVLVVNDPAINEPELLEGNERVVMRFSFNVKYRRAVG